MHKERGEHVCIFHHAKELGMSSKLCPVVRGWRRRGAQLERGLIESRQQRLEPTETTWQLRQ